MSHSYLIGGDNKGAVTSTVPYIPPTFDTALALGTDGVLCKAVRAGDACTGSLTDGSCIVPLSCTVICPHVRAHAHTTGQATPLSPRGREHSRHVCSYMHASASRTCPHVRAHAHTTGQATPLSPRGREHSRHVTK